MTWTIGKAYSHTIKSLEIPILPHDILRLVFEQATKIDRRKAVKYTLVSKLVCLWCVPPNSCNLLFISYLGSKHISTRTFNYIPGHQSENSCKRSNRLRNQDISFPRGSRHYPLPTTSTISNGQQGFSLSVMVWRCSPFGLYHPIITITQTTTTTELWKIPISVFIASKTISSPDQIMYNYNPNLTFMITTTTFSTTHFIIYVQNISYSSLTNPFISLLKSGWRQIFRLGYFPT